MPEPTSGPRAVTMQQLRGLAHLRLREAEALLQAGLYEGAAYICGYAVESALKARICRLLGVNEYPQNPRFRAAYAVHDLDQLLYLSGLSSRMKQSSAAQLRNWMIALAWNPDRRYSARGSFSREEVEEMLEAMGDRGDGVLKWVTKHW